MTLERLNTVKNKETVVFIRISAVLCPHISEHSMSKGMDTRKTRV